MKAIEYKGFLIEDNEGLMFIPFSKCPKIQITNLSNCDSQMLYAENLEEAKEIINKLTYDEAVERVENEVNLKLTNRIDLSNLDLNFVNNED